MPAALEPLAQSVLTEAVRNARKHSDAKHIVVRTHTREGTLVVEIENDGVPLERTGVDRRRAAARRARGAAVGRPRRVRRARARHVGRAARRAAARRQRRLVNEADADRLCVLVVDDHDVVHWGFRTMLGELDWVERCLSASTGDEALALTREHAPDVALVDLFLGEESGPEVCERLLTERPELRVLLISGAGRISPATARACGASGFVPKDWPAADVARAVRMVALGMALFEPAAVPASGALTLSGREREVLERIADGATNREIALALHLSPHTVKEHTSALYRKLDVRNRAEAVQKAQRSGLLN